MQFSMTTKSACMIAPEYFTHPAFAPKKVLDKNEACLSCRRRKTKCDGIRPSCGTCSRLEKNCVFPSKNSKDGVQHKVRQMSRRTSGYSKVLKSSSITKRRTSPPIKTDSIDAFLSLGADGLGVGRDIAGDERDSYSFGALRSSDRIFGSNTMTSERSRRASCVSERSQFSNSTSSSDNSSSTLAFGQDGEGLLNWFPYDTCRSISGEDIDERWFHKVEDYNLRGFKPSLSTSNHLLNGQVVRLCDNFQTDYNNSTRSSGTNDLNSLCFADASMSAFTPQVDIINSLIDIFFHKVHPILYCLNEKQFREDVSTIHTDSRRDPTALLYAILGLAAKKHPDSDIRSLAGYWNISAKVMVQDAIKDCIHSVMFVQALLWNAFWSFTAGDFSDACKGIADARTMARSLGISAATCDIYARKASSSIISDESLVDPSTRLEIRRTLWGLLRLEQAVALGSDLSASIDWDKDCEGSKFKPEDPIRNIEEDTPKISDLSSSLLGLTISLPSAGYNDPEDELNQVILLVSTIRTFHKRNSAHTTSHESTSKEEFANLQTLLTYYRLSFQTTYYSDPTKISTIPEESGHSFEPGHTCRFLIQVMLYTATILLYNPDITEVSPQGSGETYSTNQDSLYSPTILERGRVNTPFDINNTAGVPKVVSTESSTCTAVADSLTNAAANGILSMLKTAADLRPESPTLNPLLAPVYRLLSKILLRRLSEGESNMDRAKADAVISMLVLSRIGEQWGNVGFRYRDAVVAELQGVQKTR